MHIILKLIKNNSNNLIELETTFTKKNVWNETFTKLDLIHNGKNQLNLSDNSKNCVESKASIFYQNFLNYI